MQAIRGHAENDVTDLNVFPGDNAVALDDADDKARQIVFAVGIETWHFGRLSANQRAAIVLAGIGNALDYFFGDRWFKLSGCQIIHEEQRGGALHGDVVDAMVDEVPANRGVEAHFKGNFEFGSHAIDARNQNGVDILGLVDSK